MSVADNYERIIEKISKTVEKTGRTIDDIVMVAVSKNVGIDKIKAAYEAGARIFGESRINEALEKQAALNRYDIQWHFIGHLQKNKINKTIPGFSLIQSVDSLSLLEAIGKRAKRDHQVVPILLEVNTSNEDSKFGFTVTGLKSMVEGIKEIENIEIKGLMTIAMNSRHERDVRRCFQNLSKLYDDFKRYETDGFHMDYLSMGMSHDFEWALEEGANMVRIGTALFGER